MHEKKRGNTTVFWTCQLKIGVIMKLALIKTRKMNFANADFLKNLEITAI